MNMTCCAHEFLKKHWQKVLANEFKIDLIDPTHIDQFMNV